MRRPQRKSRKRGPFRVAVRATDKTLPDWEFRTRATLFTADRRYFSPSVISKNAGLRPAFRPFPAISALLSITTRLKSVEIGSNDRANGPGVDWSRFERSCRHVHTRARGGTEISRGRVVLIKSEIRVTRQRGRFAGGWKKGNKLRPVASITTPEGTSMHVDTHRSVAENRERYRCSVHRGNASSRAPTHPRAYWPACN